MRVWVALVTGLLAMTLSGCQILGGGGSGRQASDLFADERARELARAVSAGDRKAIRELVADGSPLDARGTDDITVLQWAIRENQHGALLTLLELGADVEQAGHGGTTALHTAAVVSNPRHLRTLLEHGADPDLPHAVTRETPLMAAAGSRTDEHFRLLLKHGADVHLADRNGDTALHVAAMVNAGGQVLTLLEMGADPVAQDRVGATFQDYFWTTDARLMHDRALRERRAVAQWLTAQGIPLHEDADWTKD